jgi:hypothetical protein
MERDTTASSIIMSTVQRIFFQSFSVTVLFWKKKVIFMSMTFQKKIQIELWETFLELEKVGFRVCVCARAHARGHAYICSVWHIFVSNFDHAK